MAVYSIAHELRTPLAAMAMSLELLDTSLSTPDLRDSADLVERLRRSSTWMRWLVDNLLCAAEIDRRHLHLAPRSTKIGQVVAEAHTIVEPLLARRQQQIRVQLAPDLPDVSADGRRIQQVLINLIVNASELSESGTRLTISAMHRDGWVRTSVADRGPGVSRETRRRIFRPFCSVRDEIRDGCSGLGLGLAIVHEIVTAHGGRVGAENRRQGGARFWFELPTAEVKRPPLTEVAVR